MTLSVDRKRIVQFGVVLLALPLLYALSIGPVLLLTCRLDNGDNLLVTDQKYRSAHRITITTANGLAKSTGNKMCWQVCDFYRPLCRAAAATSLSQPLFAYVRLWQLPSRQIAITGKTGTAQRQPARAPSTPAPGPQ